MMEKRINASGNMLFRIYFPVGLGDVARISIFTGAGGATKRNTNNAT
jgi:hypothetical protein